MIKIFALTFVTSLVYAQYDNTDSVTFGGRSNSYNYHYKPDVQQQQKPRFSYHHQSLHFKQNSFNGDNYNNVQLVEEKSSPTRPNIIRRKEINGKIIRDQDINGQIKSRFEPINQRETQRVVDGSILQSFSNVQKPQLTGDQELQGIGNKYSVKPDPLRYSTQPSLINTNKDTTDEPIRSLGSEQTQNPTEMPTHQTKVPTPTPTTRPTVSAIKAQKNQDKKVNQGVNDKKPLQDRYRKQKSGGSIYVGDSKQSHKKDTKPTESKSIANTVKKQVTNVESSFNRIDFNKRKNLILFGAVIACLTLSIYFIILYCLSCCSKESQHVEQNQDERAI